MKKLENEMEERDILEQRTIPWGGKRAQFELCKVGASYVLSIIKEDGDAQFGNLDSQRKAYHLYQEIMTELWSRKIRQR